MTLPQQTPNPNRLGSLPIFTLSAWRVARQRGVGHYIVSKAAVVAGLATAEEMGVTLAEALSLQPVLTPTLTGKPGSNSDIRGLPVLAVDASAEARAHGVGRYLFSADEMGAVLDLADAEDISMIEALAGCIREVRERGPRGFLEICGVKLS